MYVCLSQNIAVASPCKYDETACAVFGKQTAVACPGCSYWYIAYKPRDEHLPRKKRTRFEIALWGSCKRLQTWRDKPEPPQPASRGGLKRTPPAGNGSSSNSLATASGGGAGPAADADAGGVSDKKLDGSIAGDDAEAPSFPSNTKDGEGPGRGEKRAESDGQAAADGEEELREILLMARQAEVGAAISWLSSP